MAQRVINIGNNPNDGTGDPLRLAYEKINQNFLELYTRELNTDSQTLELVGNTLTISNGNSIELNISPTGDLQGSVFADDSTLLVDGVNGTIPGYVSLETLKTEVAASTDFADFQARIAAL